MKTLNVGLIGTGYMGQAHSIALHSAGAVFPLSAEIVCDMVVDVDPDVAAQKAKEYSFKRSGSDWKALVNDPDIDIVDICTPTFLHKEMALAAIAAGKHVYCEKPLGLSAEETREMAAAAEAAGVKTLVGFNYAKNPTVQLAKEIIERGEIGEVVHFRGMHNEDYLGDASSPFSWRLVRSHSGSGTLGDMGSHIINMANYLVGDITNLVGNLKTVHKQRPMADDANTLKDVENEDQVHLLVEFANGAQGILESSRIAHGRKNCLSFEVTGTKGSILYDQERLSELQLFVRDPDNTAREGFQRILTGPQHPDYSSFCISAGHGIGYNDQKIVEIRDLIEGIASDRPMWPQFRDAHQVSRVCDAVELSHAERRWVDLEEIP